MQLRLPSYFRFSKSVTLTLSVIIALILWAMLKLKDDYQTTFAFPCKIVGLPAGIQMQSPLIPLIHFRVIGEGSALLSASMPWNKDTLSLKYDNIFRKGWFEPNDCLNSFQLMPMNIKVERALEDSIKLYFVGNVSKKVPIISQVKIVLAPNYYLFSPAKLKPDSIRLYGDEAALKGVNAWKTANYTTPIMDKEKDIEVLLEKKEGIVCEKPSISVQILPQVYTEMQLSISLQAQKVPENVEVVFQPEKLSLKCIVPFADYEKLIQNPFTYPISYDSLLNKSSFMPDYSFLPNKVQVLPISKQEVSFTIRTIKK